MKGNILIFLCLFLIEQQVALPNKEDRDYIYLPMKKDHKYGDDICYYREIDEKLDYAVYYVKPCEKGKYCENAISGYKPFGFCKDILTNITNFPGYGESCNTDGECQGNLICDGQCKKDCSHLPSNPGYSPVQTDIDMFRCRASTYKVFDESTFCEWNNEEYRSTDPKSYIIPTTTYYGKYQGLPKECGIISFKAITDVDPSPITTTTPYSYRTFTRYIELGKKWCNIGEAKDGEFVVNKRFCKSGYTLKFYPNGNLDDPSYPSANYNEVLQEMCVTPIQVDLNNPLAGCVITYKGEGGNEYKYNVLKYYIDYNDPNSLSLTYDSSNDYTLVCNEYIVIKSQLYTNFTEEFNNASDEDKKHCYKLPKGDAGNCENIKLLELMYFYNNPKEYLFYKDREDLEKVLHYKIQDKYHRYYELSTYLNVNLLFLILFLIIF